MTHELLSRKGSEMPSSSVRGQINEKFNTLKPPPSPSKAPPKSANIAQRHSAREGVQSSSTDRRSLDLARNIPAETTPSCAVCPRRCSLDLQKNPAGSANTAGRLCLSTRPTPLDMSPLKLPSSRPSSAASSPSFKPDSPCRIQYEKREGNNGWKILGTRYKKAHANCSKEHFQNNSTESPTSSEFILTNLQALGAQLQYAMGLDKTEEAQIKGILKRTRNITNRDEPKKPVLAKNLALCRNAVSPNCHFATIVKFCEQEEDTCSEVTFVA